MQGWSGAQPANWFQGSRHQPGVAELSGERIGESTSHGFDRGPSRLKISQPGRAGVAKP